MELLNAIVLDLVEGTVLVYLGGIQSVVKGTARSWLFSSLHISLGACVGVGLHVLFVQLFLGVGRLAYEDHLSLVKFFGH